MDKDREHDARIEDLPVEAEQAAEVKGGYVDPNVKSLIDPNDKSVIDPNDKSFHWGVKPV